ncbi:SurA N-terminal domain-containing protein [Nonomuraea maritima]|uniref:SurA N-terminal domain-containing protein n=1 Tax=Nonomuraea maritima TaxID=683260 RepID=UPI00371E2169
MKSIRVAAAVATAAMALTACSSPTHAGAAAVVGSQRISTSELNKDTQDYLAALKKANLDESQLGIPATQIVLQRLVNVAVSDQILERNHVQVTEGEIDAALKDPGQFQSPEINLLSQGVAPDDARAYGRAIAGLTKLQQQFGGEAGSQRLAQEFSSVKPVINPRYGVQNPQRSQENPGIFVDAGRFGKLTAQAATQG